MTSISFQTFIVIPNFLNASLYQSDILIMHSSSTHSVDDGHIYMHQIGKGKVYSEWNIQQMNPKVTLKYPVNHRQWLQSLSSYPHTIWGFICWVTWGKGCFPAFWRIQRGILLVQMWISPVGIICRRAVLFADVAICNNSHSHKPKSLLLSSCRGKNPRNGKVKKDYKLSFQRVAMGEPIYTDKRVGPLSWFLSWNKQTLLLDTWNLFQCCTYSPD